MTKSKCALALLCLFVGLSTHAQSAPQDATEVALKFIKSSDGFKRIRKAGRPIKLEATPVAGTPFHAVNLSEDNGFVLLDASGKVYGYSDEGRFDPSVLPVGMLAAQGRPEGVSATGSDTNNYTGIYGTYRPVAPLITSTWGQDWPYNSHCPIWNSDVTTNRKYSAAGCVPLAIGQIMRYHRFPEQFAWDRMLDHYSAETSAEEASAVATMLHEIGVAMKADYSHTTSVYDGDVLPALKAYGFSPSAREIHGSIYSRPAVEAIILEELAAARPVYLAGNGHAFLCDGNDANGFLHINWGWNGTSNGYYSVSILAPQVQGTGATDGCYAADHLVVGIARPQPTDKKVSDELLAYSFSHTEGNRFELTAAKYIQSYSFSGYYDDFLTGPDILNGKQTAIKACNRATGEETVVAAARKDGEGEITSDVALADGSYSLFPVYRTESDGEWHTLWSVAGRTAVVGLTVANGQAVYENPSTGTPEISIASLQTEVDAVKGITLSVKMSASKASVNSASVKACLYDADGRQVLESDFPSGMCVDVPAGTTKEFCLRGNLLYLVDHLPENAIMDVTIGDIKVVDRQPVEIMSYAFDTSEDTKWMRAMKKSGIDANNDGFVSDAEIMALETLTLDDPGIHSLSDIKIPFPKVHSIHLLNCDEIKKITLADFPSRISVISAENCKNVKKADLTTDGDFYAFSFSECPQLSELVLPKDVGNINSVMLSFTGLESVDLSAMSNLVSLNVHNNPALTTLDLPSALPFYNSKDIFYLKNNPALKSLDLSAFKGLEKIELQGNGIEALTLPADCSTITFLNLKENHLSSLDISKAVNLRVLQVNDNPLTKLDVSALLKLEELSCNSTDIQYLDLTGLNALKSVDCNQCARMLFLNTPPDVNIWSNFYTIGDYSELDLSDAVVHGMVLSRLTEIQGARLVGNKLVRNEDSEYFNYRYLPYEGAGQAFDRTFYDKNCEAEFDEESISLAVGQTVTVTLREKGNFFAIGRVVSENDEILRVDWSRTDDNQGHHIVPVTITRLAPGDCHVIIKDFGSLMKDGDRLLVTEKPAGITDVDGDTGKRGNRLTYDLTGRPASSALNPGIYIRNGKKFIVR